MLLDPVARPSSAASFHLPCRRLREPSKARPRDVGVLDKEDPLCRLQGQLTMTGLEGTIPPAGNTKNAVATTTGLPCVSTTVFLRRPRRSRT